MENTVKAMLVKEGDFWCIGANINVKTQEKHCPEHGVYVAESFFKGIFTGCPVCQKARLARETAERNAQIAKENRERMAQMAREKLALEMDIPKRFVGKTVAAWQPETESEHMAKAAVVGYGKQLMTDTQGNLILHGNKGTGKTHLACALLALVKEKKGGSVQYAVVSDFFRRVRESKNFKSPTSETDILNEFSGFDLLALDEIGNQRGDDDERRVLFDLLNKRYEKGLPTVLISNLGTEKLVDFLGEILWDRLQEGSLTVQFDGRSRRQVQAA